MRILITGASGFIGTELVEKLSSENHQIYCQSRGSHEDTTPSVVWVKHDLVNDSWERLLLPEVEVVYHLAGQTSTYVARQDPLGDLKSNVVSLLNLLDYLKKQSHPPFVVIAGTATEVGLTDCLPVHEKMRDNPITFYDISKLAAEMYLKQYVREKWVRGCSLRLANVFGRSRPGQREDRGVIDKIFKRAASGQNITLYGDGHYLRDYVFIDDVISALISAAVKPDHTNGRSFFIGSGEGITLKDAFAKVITLAESITGIKVALEHVDPPAGMSDIEYRNAVMDTSAFQQATGWAPQYDFDFGLKAAYQCLKP